MKWCWEDDIKLVHVLYLSKGGGDHKNTREVNVSVGESLETIRQPGDGSGLQLLSSF